jgi:hypothetical protein
LKLLQTRAKLEVVVLEDTVLEGMDLKDTIQTEFVLEVVVLEDTVLEGMPYERNK